MRKIPCLLILFLGCLIIVAPFGSNSQNQGLSTMGIKFIDIAQKAGLNFQHFSGSSEKTYILEGMSGGVAWIDYDRDGWLDLYLVNGGLWDELLKGKRSISNALYRNKGDGTFIDVTKKAGVGNHFWGMGVAASDYDNDGWTDLYVCNYGPNTLYRNNGDGTFTDVTDKAKVGDKRWAVSAAFGDYDSDGHLDLYVTNTVQFDHNQPPPMNCHYRGIIVQCGPLGLVPDADILYHNNGDGTFSDVTKKTQVGNVKPSYGLGVAWSDYDNDSDLDLYVANDQMANFLFQNQGNGSFIEVGLMSGAGYSDDGLAQGSMGVDLGDYDHDGLLDIFLTHFSDDYNTLYRNLGNGNFRDVSHLSEIAFPSWPFLGWGTGFVDVDNDGWEDLFIANGHLDHNISDIDPIGTYAQRNQVFMNQKGRAFIDQSATMLEQKQVSRGSAFGDLDNDGDIDIVVSNLNDHPVILWNVTEHTSNWFILKLIGTSDNQSAIGTRVKIKVDQQIQIREVKSGSGYLSQSDLRLHFGLGQAKQIDQLEIHWPNGTTQQLNRVPGNQILTVTQEKLSG